MPKYGLKIIPLLNIEKLSGHIVLGVVDLFDISILKSDAYLFLINNGLTILLSSSKP